MNDKILKILNMIRPELDFTESIDYINDSYLDSLDMMLLVSTIDKEFGISIQIYDILPENFANVDSIAGIINKYLMLKNENSK